jgi:O-antigen/teichoic acid export membrane protein
MKKYLDSLTNQGFLPARALLQGKSLGDVKTIFINIYKHFLHDSLYRNSIYLMITTFISAGFGFFFWMVNARLFSAEQIGLATALISLMMLISNFSLLGLNLGIIRYLPTSDKKVDKINTVLSTIVITTLISSAIMFLGLEYFFPNLLFLRGDIIFLLLFLAITVFFTLDFISNSIFVAYRNTKYVLYKSLIGNIFKVAAPFVLFGLGTYAIFISATFGSVLTFFISLYILYKVFGHKFRFTIQKAILRKMSKLSFGNYVASFMATLPVTLLPIMITNQLGAKQAAYFYLDMMIVNLLNIIQFSLNQSLFAEGSNNSSALKENVIKSLKMIGILLIPAIIGVFLFGEYVLNIFGKEYSTEGVQLLYLLSLSTIFISINTTLSSILNVKGKVHIILLMCFTGAAILLTLSYFALPYGLIALGIALLIGEALIALIYSLIVFFKLR